MENSVSMTWTEEVEAGSSDNVSLGSDGEEQMKLCLCATHLQLCGLVVGDP